MEIRDDIFVEALRNAEVVFNKAVFNRAACPDRGGQARDAGFSLDAHAPQARRRLRPDTPWVAFYGEAKGVGFASLFVDLALPNRHGGPASQQQPFIYIQNGPWYYMSRGFVYSFATNNQTRMLPVRAGEPLLREERLLSPSPSRKAEPASREAGRPYAMSEVIPRPRGGRRDLRREPGGLGRRPS